MIDRARESRNPKKVIRVTLMESYGEIGRVPVNLCRIGVGRKVYVTRTEYELEYYDSVNYEILTAEEYIKACEEN